MNDQEDFTPGTRWRFFISKEQILKNSREQESVGCNSEQSELKDETPENSKNIWEDYKNYLKKMKDSVENEADNETLDKEISHDAALSAEPKILVVENKEIEEQENEDELVEAEAQSQGGIIINTRALPKHALTYEVEKFEKNALIIFNQENVDGYVPRSGTEKDVDALTKTFENLGFEVKVYKDFTKEQIFRQMKTFSESNFTDYGCVAVAVLTHGTKGKLRAKDQLYSEMEILNYFKVHDKPTLITKPKLLIIQACRGKTITPAVPVMQAFAKVTRDFEEDFEHYELPVEADMLVLHSSYVGNPAWRDKEEGSWLIQTFCRKINDLASSQDLESIITEVKREVAIDHYYQEFNRRTGVIDVIKQIPVLTSTLIRKLYFKKPEVFPEPLHQDVKQTQSNNVMDMEPPNTPLQVQYGPCRCFLDHFCYIRDCLRHYLEENTSDETAKAFLEVANRMEDMVEFNAAKQSMLRAICNHLKLNTRDIHYNKYLHFYQE